TLADGLSNPQSARTSDPAIRREKRCCYKTWQSGTESATHPLVAAGDLHDTARRRFARTNARRARRSGFSISPGWFDLLSLHHHGRDAKYPRVATILADSA